MDSQQLETLMTEMKLPWQRIVKDMWAVEDTDKGDPRIVITVEDSLKKNAKLLKFIVFICDVPNDAAPEFFKEFLKLNFRVDHGTFAMESLSEMSFIDTLEMEHLDREEFETTFAAMRNAPHMFKEKFDVDVYSMGKPQY